ncbi:hypothetical protein MTO96_031619 [Rhipicephalus appendiculatus]
MNDRCQVQFHLKVKRRLWFRRAPACGSCSYLVVLAVFLLLAGIAVLARTRPTAFGANPVPKLAAAAHVCLAEGSRTVAENRRWHPVWSSQKEYHVAL